MIKIILVGGVNHTTVADRLNTSTTMKVVKSFAFVSDAYDYFTMEQGFIDYDKILVLQMGIKENDDKEQQIISLQKALLLEYGSNRTRRPNLYFLLKETALYKRCASQQSRIFKYSQTNIIYSDELKILFIEQTVEGRHDKKDLYHPEFSNSIGGLSFDDLDDLDLDVVPPEYDENDPDFLRSEAVRKRIEEEERLRLEEEQRRIEEEKRLQEEARKRIEDERKRQELEKKKQIEEARKRAEEEKKRQAEEKKRREEEEKRRLAEEKKNKGKNAKSVKLAPKDIIFRGIIAVSGDRQSGISTTVANLGQTYAEIGLRTLIIDCDTVRKFLPILFPDFRRYSDYDRRVKRALYLVLNNPTLEKELRVVVETNLAMIALDDDDDHDVTIASKRREELFVENRFIGLLSLLKSSYDIILLDFPMDLLKEMPLLATFIDRILFCCPNTTYHLTNLLYTELETLRDEDDVTYSMILSKAYLVLTKYNNFSKVDKRELTPQKVEALLEATHDPLLALSVLAKITMNPLFESQFSTNKRIISFDSVAKEEFLTLAKNLA